MNLFRGTWYHDNLRLGYVGEDDNKQRLNIQTLKSRTVQPYAVLNASLPVPPTSLSRVMLDAAPIASVVRRVGSGFGGLGVACRPLVPKFAGSNPAEAVGFFGAKKSPEGK
jgi:hypothetical protein